MMSISSAVKQTVATHCKIWQKQLNSLYFTAKGVGEQSKAGLISSVAQDAGKLNMSSEQMPVVAIETDSA